MKSRTKKIILAVTALVVVLALGIILWMVFAPREKFERYQFDTGAIAGRISKMSDEEAQQELDRMVEEGMFNISIASTILFPSPEEMGEARIENIPENRYHMQVDIFLDDTNQCIYESDLIRPGYSIEEIRLKKPLAPGIYPATAIFSAVTQDTMELFGQVGAKIELCVLDGGDTVPRS